MTISINDAICEKYNLTLGELLSILLIKETPNLSELFKALEERGAVIKDVFGNYMITQRWDDIASSVLLDSDKNFQPQERLDKLASKLMDIFPKGKKEGTCHYFRGNKKDNLLRLKKFFKIYGKYSDEEILNAAKRYVESFNGNYTYMRILKYFIWKDDVKLDSEGSKYVDHTSDLANWIENKENIIHSNDWTSNLI